MRTDVAAWLARASADAEARGLDGLKPLLEGLARSTEALRNADPSLSGAAAASEDKEDGTDHAG
jgi:hypothetical protein